jgi:hypothetical protein
VSNVDVLLLVCIQLVLQCHIDWIVETFFQLGITKFNKQYAGYSRVNFENIFIINEFSRCNNKQFLSVEELECKTINTLFGSTLLNFLVGTKSCRVPETT